MEQTLLMGEFIADHGWSELKATITSSQKADEASENHTRSCKYSSRPMQRCMQKHTVEWQEVDTCRYT